jgi:uncharacterized protein
MNLNFTNNDESKLTALFKCLFYWLLFLISLFIIGTFISPKLPLKFEQFSYGIFGSIAAFLITWLFIKLEKKTFSDYQLVWENKTLPNFLIGLVIGSLLLICIVLFLVSFSDLELKYNPKHFDPTTLLWYLAIIPLALMEEIAFRSYPFLKLHNIFGLRITQIFVAVAFALYHYATGWSIESAFFGPGVWAFTFGLAAIYSKGIAVPTGIHVGLNLLQQIIGLKNGFGDSIWILDFESKTTPEVVAKAETTGNITQVIVFILAVVLTEYFIRIQSKGKNA